MNMKTWEGGVRCQMPHIPFLLTKSVLDLVSVVEPV